MGATLEVGERRLVWCDHAGARTRLDRHIAQRHAALHGEPLDSFAAVLQHVALSATRADARDHREDEVLGRDAVRQRAVDGDRHGLEGLERQRLRGEHVLDLARANSEGERTEGAVGRGVRVAADHGHAGLGETELRAHHVDDALVLAAQGEERHAELRAVRAQGLDLSARDRIGDGLVDVDRGDVVVLGRQGEIGAAYDASGRPQGVECLGARDLVDEVEVDIEEIRLALGAAHDVRVPDLLCQRLAHVHSFGEWAKGNDECEKARPPGRGSGLQARGESRSRSPDGIRTRATALRGRRARPLHNGAVRT